MSEYKISSFHHHGYKIILRSHFFSHRLQFYAKYLGLAYFRSDFVCFGVILSLIGRRISLGPPHSKAKLLKTAMN